MLATTALVFMLGLSAYYKQASTPNNTGTSVQSKRSAETSESVLTDDELWDRIKQLVKSLEYPDEVAEDFNRMAIDWKNELGRPVLIVWKDRLARVHRLYQQGKVNRSHIAKIEIGVLEELCKIIKKQFSNKTLGFELSDMIEHRQANCLGYSQLIYIIGNAIGLSVKPIDVLNPAISVKGDVSQGHMACIVDLSDGRSVMLDVSLLYESPSKAFKFEDHFIKMGNDWELRYQFNRLLIHRKIRLLDRKELIAVICYHRGVVYKSKGEYDRAILEFNKAIEIDPEFAMAYNGRGNAYQDKGEYDQAILDYTKAIEIDPSYANAYNNRGYVYADKGELEKAILDFTKATEIAPRFALAYFNRGCIYDRKGKHDLAILDFTKAIEIEPEAAYAYNNRGIVFANKDEFDRAILDFTKAIELDPKDSTAYSNRGAAYANEGDFGPAILDFDKAIRLDPKFTDAYINRGKCYCKKKEYGRAMLDFIKAFGIHLKNAVAYIPK
jgi:tetratricopeptide (TPR) repeat protein